jgi:NAD(P)H-hydrate epimerase
MQTFGRYTGNLITITVEQMRKVDYLMENKYGINIYQMMENAGRSLALLSKKYFHDGTAKDKKVAVLAGKGGNGGGAIVAGRRLQNWGANVQVFLVNYENELKPITKAQLDIVRKMGIPVHQSVELTDKDRFDIVLDGIYGYGLQGPPEKKAAYMINWTQGQQSIVLSLDTPSGIELSTGKIHTSAIKANATLTLALPKDELLCKDCAKYTGELFLADISVPYALYVDLNLEIPIPDYFSNGDIVQICGKN